MALQGTFNADFTSFYDACQKAEVSLRTFETGASKVENSLNRMVDGFSGRRIISEATLMAEAIERIGGPSKLTANELQRVGATAAEAAAKMSALGIDVPPALQKLATATQQIPGGLQAMTTATGGASSALGTFRTGLGAADRTLALFGVRIGPEIRALDELAASAGKTAAQLGVIGTVALSAAAALAGWKVGRLVSDFFDLDESIGKVTAKLMGFGDLAAQTAGAKMDVLARATKIAGVEITNFADAQSIIIEANTRFAESMNTSEVRVKNWSAELAAVSSRGLLGRLRADLASQDSTLQELSAQYHVSVRALEFFERATKTAADAQKVLADEHKKAQKIVDDLAESTMRLTKAQQEHINSIGDKLFGSDDIKRATDYAEAIGRLENVSNLSAEAQKEVADVMTAGIEAMVAAGRSTDDLTSTFEALRLKSTETSRDAVEAFQRIQAEAALAAAMMQQVMGLTIVGQTPGSPVTSGGAGSLNQTGNAFFTGMAAGGPVRAGQPYMVGERGPELFVPSSNGSISPNGAGGSVTNHIYVNGTAEDVARKVMDEITRTMRGGRKWPAV